MGTRQGVHLGVCMSVGVLISFLHYGPVWGQSFCLGAKLPEWEKDIPLSPLVRGWVGVSNGKALNHGGLGSDMDG